MRFGVRRSHGLRRGVLALATAGALGVLLWGLSGAPKSVAGWTGTGLLWLACAGTALRFAARLPEGELAWDGASWHFEAPGCTVAGGALRVHMDGQSRLLVSLQGNGGRIQWLWLERRMQPERWADLRRAVYSRPRPDAGQGIPTASADRGQA